MECFRASKVGDAGGFFTVIEPVNIILRYFSGNWSA